MENFVIYNPVKAYFGRGVIGEMADEVSQRGSRVLLVYGKGSIRENGIYDAVMEQLNEAVATVTEYAGIKPNPVIEDVRAATALAREKDVELIVAVGGGSVIDSAKAIAVSVPGHADPWDYVKGKETPQKGIPLIAVLTLAATGTEMNRFAVIQDDTGKEKLGFGYPPMYPVVSFLDPSYTISVPADYTAYGITDLIAHALEAYFGAGDASLSDRFVIAIISEAMEYGPRLMKDPGSYDLRARIMYAATMALNNLTMYGRVSGDWGVHSIGHVLSVLYDLPHGATLSIAYPAWMRLHAEKAGDRIRHLGGELFGVDTVEDTVTGFEDFFTGIGSPVRLLQTQLKSLHKEEIIRTLEKTRAGGNHHRLNSDDYPVLTELMW
jgi:alcohol dehydrogenase YqhD (iron-dependent ADH family)